MRTNHKKTYLVGFIILLVITVIGLSAYHYRASIQNGFTKGWESTK